MSVVPFPTPEITAFSATMRLNMDSIVKQEAVEFELDNIATAMDAFSLVMSDLAKGNTRLRNRDDLSESDVLLCGETLSSALNGVESLLHLCSSNRDRALADAVRQWLTDYEKDAG